jgi:3-demethoxyubiquinol 3-hydroxylase
MAPAVESPRSAVPSRLRLRDHLEGATMAASPRPLTPLDRLVVHLDRSLRALAGVTPGDGRSSPAEGRPEADLAPGERRHAAGLMRVNHAGEIAAQALYQGQALTARDPAIRATLEEAAREEADHLRWCRQRLEELDARPSLLDPVWYVGSFMIGAVAGALGDRVSLGFLAETERQVVDHLETHLARLPPDDGRSRAVLERMREDEARHSTTALEAGGGPLPAPARGLMRAASRVMTRTAYWI